MTLLVVETRLHSDSLGSGHVLPALPLLLHQDLPPGLAGPLRALRPDPDMVTIHTLRPLDDLVPGHQHLAGLAPAGLAHHGLLKYFKYYKIFSSVFPTDVSSLEVSILAKTGSRGMMNI